MRDRDLRPLGDLPQQLGGIGDLDTMPGENERPFAPGDEPGQLVGLGDVAAHRPQQSRQAQLVPLGMWRGRFGLEHVLREVEEDRPRATGAGDLERLGDRQRHLVGVHDDGRVLRHRQRDADDIGLLEGVLAEQRPWNVAGDGDHGDAVHHGGGEAGDQVDGARPAGGDGNANASGGAAEAVGCVGAALLVTDQDVAQRELAQHVVDRQDRAARVAEDGGDPLADQRLAYGAGTDARGNGPCRRRHRLAFGKSEGCHRSVHSSLTNKNPAEAPGLAGWWLRCVSGLLVPGASSIPPSKENDEPKNRDYEEHAEEPDAGRAHDRLGGAHAALL